MYCITRADMKFKDFIIPARTKAIVINEPSYTDANVPGLYLRLAISLTDAALKTKTSVPLSEVEYQNDFEGGFYKKTKMTGIVVETDGQQVFIDAGDRFYQDASIYKWEVDKIFPDGIPNNIREYRYQPNRYYLNDIIEYLENEFAEWVENNCEFKKLTKRDIENGDGFEGSEPGDLTLSDFGMQQFDNKKFEYQNRLEKIGFTYDFKGGLLWD